MEPWLYVSMMMPPIILTIMGPISTPIAPMAMIAADDDQREAWTASRPSVALSPMEGRFRF